MLQGRTYISQNEAKEVDNTLSRWLSDDIGNSRIVIEANGLYNVVTFDEEFMGQTTDNSVLFCKRSRNYGVKVTVWDGTAVDFSADPIKRVSKIRTSVNCILESKPKRKKAFVTQQPCTVKPLEPLVFNPDSGFSKDSEHYKAATFQPVQVTQRLLTPQQFLGWLKGTEMKYRLRAGLKDSKQKDLEKAAQYEYWYNIMIDDPSHMIDPIGDSKI